MTVAAVRDETLRLGDRLVKVLRAVEREHGRELFVRERLFQLHALDLADEDLRRVGHAEAADLGDLGRALTDDLRIERTVDDHGAAHLVLLFLVEDVAAARGELRLDRVVHLVLGDDGLLGRTDQTVIEGLGMDDGVDRNGDVRRRVDDGGGVARADAERRFARAVRAAHHAGAARREDDVRRLHQRGGHVQRRNVDPADDALGRARLDGGVEHDFRRGDGAALCARVRRDDDAVARFEADERLEDRRRSRVGGRDDRRDDADRLCDLLHAVGGILFDHAARLHILVLVVDILCGVVVFDDLVLHDAHAGLGDSHLRERDTLVVCSQRRRPEDLIDLFLGVGGKLFLRLPDLFDLFHQGFDRIDELVLHTISPLKLFFAV